MAYIQVGVTAQRTSMGEFLPSVPLYIQADKINKNGLAVIEELPLRDISGLFINKYKEIYKGGQAI